MGLTRKQTAFAVGIIEGKTAADAYRAAGYATDNMSARTIAVEASRLRRHEGVRRLIEAETGKAAERAAWSRLEAVERLERANTRLLGLIDSETPDTRAVAGFMDTLRELNRLANVDVEVTAERAERTATEARDRDGIEATFKGEW